MRYILLTVLLSVSLSTYGYDWQQNDLDQMLRIVTNTAQHVKNLETTVAQHKAIIEAQSKLIVSLNGDIDAIKDGGKRLQPILESLAFVATANKAEIEQLSSDDIEYKIAIETLIHLTKNIEAARTRKLREYLRNKAN